MFSRFPTVQSLLAQSGLASLRGRSATEGGVDQFSVLNVLMAKMLTYQKLDPLLQHIADTVIQVTEATNALILMVDETEEFLSVVASAGASSVQNIGERRKYGVGFAGLAWSTKTDQYLANSDALEVTKGFWPPASQLVAVPLMSTDTVIGVAVLAAPAHYKNFRTSASMVRHLASLAGIAIVNARSREQAVLELSRMRALREINALLANFECAADLIQAVSKTLMNAMDISRAIYFMVEDDGVTEHADIWIKEDGKIIRGVSIVDDILNEGLNGWCYRNNKAAFLPRNHEDERESVRVRKRRKASNIGSTFCVPISGKDRVVGVISISRDLNKRDLNESDRNLFFSICNQISSALLNHELSVALKHRAFHDSLTELPNRFYFEKELDAAIERATHSRSGCVMFLDLDGFKSVNDSLGHHFGDELLTLVANRFNACLSSESMLARIGGDEFAIISRNVSTESEAQLIARRLINTLSTNFYVKGASVKIGVSVGLSLYPRDGNCAETLIRNADEAMYRAKANGKGRVVCFNQRMAEDSRQRIQLETELREALWTDQFELYYQPQVDTITGDVSSVEALIRWHHPRRGLVSPGEFIPIAEEAGLINAVGDWVLEEAVSQMATWRGGVLNNLRVGVNVSASQFLQESFSDQVLNLLGRYSIAPESLEIEVTESIVMNEIQRVISTLDRLRTAGVRVAVDDFGTGYSSLSYLQDLPLDVLKIDRSFINRLETGTDGQSVANTIMLLAEGLGLETVAEGVETAEQFEQVRRLGCTMIQGFHFAKPCSANDLVSSIDVIRDIFYEFDLKKAS